MGGPRSPGILEPLLVVLVVGVSCGLVLPVSAGATLPGRNGRIAMITQECDIGDDTAPCEDNLAVVNRMARGSLTLGPDDEVLDFVAFSHRGVTLAYGYYGDIYVAPFAKLVSSKLYNGPVGVRLTRSLRDDSYTRPRWSPSGRTLLVIRRYFDHSDWSTAMYKISVRKKRAWRFAPRFTTQRGWHETHPDWSSRGEIAFEDGPGLWVIDDAGTRRHRLTAGPKDLFPCWSPDGKRLAFERYKSESSLCGAIYTVRRDGHDLRRLVGDCSDRPAWSPDGRSIAFLKGADRPSLKAAMRAFLRSIQRRPARVAAYLHSDTVRYATATH